MKLDRTDKEVAREVFEFLLPDEKVRWHCLNFLADSIQIANQLAAHRWGVTLDSDSMRLNCGMIEVVTILPDWIHVVADAESLPIFSPALVEVRKTRNGAIKGFYPSVPGSIACDFDAKKSILVLPQIADSHNRLLQKASRTPFAPNRKKAHSPGVIEYLEDCLDQVLPQPEYSTTHSTNNIQTQHELRDVNELERFPDVEQEVILVIEGRKKFISHLRRERNPEIVEAKKNKVLNETGKLACEACGFDFKQVYGEFFAEAHHRALLSAVETETETTLDDLAILCANCHRMIHRTKPMKTIEQFREQLARFQNEARND